MSSGREDVQWVMCMQSQKNACFFTHVHKFVSVRVRVRVCMCMYM